MGFQVLAEVYNTEKGSSSLKSIPEDFYERATTYIKSLLVDIENHRGEEGNRLDYSTLRKSDDYKRAKELLERIYSTRERKIVLLALNSSRGVNVKTGEMTDMEESFYYTLKVEMERTRDRFLRYDAFMKKPERPRKATGIDTTTDDFVSETEPSPKENKGSSAKTKEERECKVVRTRAKDLSENDLKESGKVRDNDNCLDGYKIVRAVKDIEPFVTGDGRTISLDKEDVATLEENVAAILVNSGKAKIVGV